jgi:LuxR family transcriptional regulator, maltose regulon positive regulatory protein
VSQASQNIPVHDQRTSGPTLPFPLREAKLSHPPSRPGTVSRAALVEPLRRLEAPPVVSVTAPAGFGKTTLLVQWVERDQRPVVWISVDDRDNDPTVLLTYFAVALDRIQPLNRPVLYLLARPGVSAWSTIAAGLGRELASRSELLIVLDDADHLHQRDSLDALATLVEQVPRGSQLVLAGRAEPDLPLARLRAEGRLDEIGPDELRLNDREAHELVTNAGLEVSEDDATELNRHAEGWPAGLYLAALAGLADASDPHSVATLGGDDRYIADYLRLEALYSVTPAEAEFLTRTSELERMCGPLCDAVLGREDSARVLELLESSNLFLVPLDRRRGWYRYHQLFRDLLRAEMRQREPELVPELNARAMDWFVANDLPEEAIDYGSAAGRTEAVIGLVEALTVPLYLSGRVATLERWLERFGDESALVRHPALAVLGAWVWLLTGHPMRGERWADLVQHKTLTEPLPDGGTSIEPWLALLRAWMCRQGVERARADAELALTELVPGSPWLPTAYGAIGAASLLVGDIAGADRAFADAVKVASELEDLEGGAVGFGLRSVIAMQRGAWDDAAEYARAGRTLAREGRLDSYVTCGIVHVASARVAVHQGHEEQALRHAALVHSVRPLLTSGLPWLSTQVLVELTQVHLRLGDAAAARAVLAEAAAILRQRPKLGVLGDQVAALEQQVASLSGPAGRWAFTLTAAELELLPLLATCLTFAEIAERRYVSRNTVKTQAISIYRKLGASSRSQAIERAAELGLIDPMVDLPRKITPSGR